MGIIFSTRFYQALKDTRPLPLITAYTKGKYGGRLIGSTLKFQSYDDNGKVVRGNFFKPFVVSSYDPCDRFYSDKEHWKYNGILDTLLIRAPNNSEILMRVGVNCSIWSRDQ